MAVAIDLLNQREQEIAARLPGIDLLGELDLVDRDRGEIARCLRALLAGNSVETACCYISKHWSNTLAAYLVAEGIAGYKGGAYWVAVSEATGLPPEARSQWGQIFEQVVRRAGKPTFRDLVDTQHASRYVMPILAHGGIPDYCLGDLFRFVLHHRAHGERWCDADAHELVSEWRTQRQPLSFVDQPVRRFLLFGGAVAQDFLARALTMARRALDEGAVPHATELGLPERVVARYRAFFAELGAEARRAAPAAERGGARFARPWLAYDPWSGGIELMLPEQTLPDGLLLRRACWSLTIGGEAAITTALVRRRGGKLLTEEASLWLPRAGEAYAVALKDDGGELIRQWTLPGMATARPLLLFSPRTGRAIDSGSGLPAEQVWIVAQRRLELRVRRAGSSTYMPAPELEEFPPLGGGWASSRAVCIDLEGCDRLCLQAPGAAAVLDLPVLASAAEPPRPRLSGGNRIGAIEDGGDGPFYAGELPDLIVPAVDGAGLDRWQIQVWPLGVAVPGRAVSARLASFSPREGPTPDTLAVPLANILGADALGTFRVDVRGPLGRDAALRLRIAPRLSVAGAERLVLPGDAGGVTIAAALGMAVVADGDDTTVVARPQLDGGQAWSVTPAEEGAGDLGVRICRALADGHVVEIAARIRMRRLRWTVLGIDGAAGSAPVVQPLTVDRDGFDTAGDPRLLLDVPAPDGEPVALQLALSDAAGELQATEWQRAGGAGRCVLRLGGFRDSLRSSPRQTATFELRLRRGEDRPFAFPVARLVRSLAVSGLCVDIEQAGDEQRITASWSAARALPERALLLWSLRRPWDPPRCLPLPDGDDTWHGVIDPPLSSGRYRATVTVLDPWIGGASLALPRAGAPAAADLRVRAVAHDVDADAEQDDLLDRFFAAEPASPNDAAIVAPLALLLRPLLRGELRRNYGQQAHARAAAACARDLGALIAAAAQEADGLSYDDERQLVALLVRAGAGSCSTAIVATGCSELDAVDELWRLWPPLGLFADIDRALAGDRDAAERCRHGLGPSALDTGALGAAEEEDGGEPEVAGGVPAGLAGLIAGPPGIRTPAMSLLRGWTSDLREGLLGGSILVQAQHQSEAITSASAGGTRSIREDVAAYLPTLDRLRRDIRQAGLAPRAVLDVLDTRREPDRTLRNVPYVVGMAALLQRLRARRPDGLRGVLRSPESDTLGWFAFRVAPLLYERDLCFAELALAVATPATLAQTSTAIRH